jgi:hypothetical protein
MSFAQLRLSHTSPKRTSAANCCCCLTVLLLLLLLQVGEHGHGALLHISCKHKMVAKCCCLDHCVALLLLLLQVGEHGIGALLRAANSNEPLEPLGDIAGGDSTWRAWKHVGLHTAQVSGRE